MYKTYFILICLLIQNFYIQAQENSYTQSGFTSLTVKLSGPHPNAPDISTPHAINPLSFDKPIKFQTIDDSTFMLSFFTFGPTIVYFRLDKNYQTSMLLPNQSDVLEIHYIDPAHYLMNYQGYAKEFFENSSSLENLLKNYFSYEGELTPGKGVNATFETANEFKNARLEYINNMIQDLSKNEKSEAVKRQFSRGMTDYAKSSLTKYRSIIGLYNERLGLDSLERLKYIPKRDLFYYEGIIDSTYADTISLISSAYYDFLKDIREDSLLNLPLISQVGPDNYKKALKQIFGRTFSQDDNLFYDMFIANAYIGQINSGIRLSNKEKNELVRYFKNRQVSNYILYQQEVNALAYAEKSKGKYYLTFEKTQDSVLTDILSRYKGKVVVMDFWATWCGPCIGAFEQIKEVKARYANRDDVVFVYMTEESSDFSKWNDYVNVLGGEHYYLYNEQSAVIDQHYGIKYIPSYLIFNKKGELSQRAIGGYMGNETAIRWIDKASEE